MSRQTASNNFIDFALYILHAQPAQTQAQLVNRWNMAVQNNPPVSIVDRAQKVKMLAKENGFNFDTQQCIDAINFWETWHTIQGGPVGPVAY